MRFEKRGIHREAFFCENVIRWGSGSGKRVERGSERIGGWRCCGRIGKGRIEKTKLFEKTVDDDDDEDNNNSNNNNNNNNSNALRYHCDLTGSL